MSKIYNLFQFLCIFICVSLSTQPLWGQSLYSSVGIGELRYVNTVRSAGLGGSGIALPDHLAYNVFNPALGADLNDTSIGGSFIFEGLRTTQNETQFSNRLIRWNGISLNIKVLKNLSISGGFSPLSDYFYDFNFNTSSAGYQTQLQGRGGVSIGYAGVAWRISKPLAVGLTFQRYFGRLEEDSIIDFDDNAFLDTHDTVTHIFYGNSLKIGVHLSLSDNTQFGGYVNIPSSFTGTRELSYSYRSGVDNFRHSYQIPLRIGAGGTHRLTERLLINSDFDFFQGKNLKIADTVQPYFDNGFRISAGGEYLITSDQRSAYRDRVAYRLGGFYNRPYVRDSDGSALHEFFLTTGLGLPLFRTSARLDIAFEFGLRGNSNKDIASERVFRFLIGIHSIERWFFRPER